jgi:group I intron endonuclease
MTCPTKPHGIVCTRPYGIVSHGDKPHGIVYLLRNTNNLKVYIGQTVRTLESRWKQHVSVAGSNPTTPASKMAIVMAIRKHGPEAFTQEVLATCSSQEELDATEARFIRELRSTDPEVGYNLDDRPKGTGPRTEETRRRISAALKGKGFSAEHRRRISQNKRGKVPWNKGRSGICSCAEPLNACNHSRTVETQEALKQQAKGWRTFNERRRAAKERISFHQASHYLPSGATDSISDAQDDAQDHTGTKAMGAHGQGEE